MGISARKPCFVLPGEVNDRDHLPPLLQFLCSPVGGVAAANK
jgi:hypothetical protein